MTKSVLIVHKHLIYGGAEKYTLNLANTLAKKGNTVILITGDGPLARHVSPKVRHFILPISRKERIKKSTEKAILAIAEEYQPDIIHTQCRTSMINSQLARTKLQIPLITHEHHMYNLPDYPFIVGELKTGADKIITIGPYTAQALHQHGIADEIVAPVINGVDVENVQPISPEERRIARARLNFLPSDKIVVCISRLEPGKGIEKLAKAFIRVSKEMSEAKLVIMGNDATTQTQSIIEEIRTKYHLEKVIFHYPGEYNIRKYHAIADIFCYPALVKGMAVMEAMAAGLPVVGKKTERHPLVVEHMVSGLMTETSVNYAIDPDQIAEKLLYLLQRPRLSKKMGKAGRATIKKYFTLERMTTDILKVYDETIKTYQPQAYDHVLSL